MKKRLYFVGKNAKVDNICTEKEEFFLLIIFHNINDVYFFFFC